MSDIYNHIKGPDLASNRHKAAVELIEPAVNECGFDLYDVRIILQGKFSRVQVFIDSEGGVTLENCETVSRKISLLLDVEDIFPFSYALEVSSPGIFRELRTEKELKKSINKRLQIKCKVALTEKVPVQTYTGILKAVESDALTFIDEKNGKTNTIEIKNLKKISLAPKL